MNDVWQIVEEGYDPEITAKQESLFTLGNGFFGMRGFFEERAAVYHAGVFINGFYELEPITYGESAYGYADMNQKMIDLPDARYVEVYIDGDPVRLDSGIIHHQKRVLDMREGVLRRELDWESNKGSRVLIQWESLISYTHMHVGAIRVTVTPLSCTSVEIHSSVVMPLQRVVDVNDPRVSATSDHQALQLQHISYGEDAPYEIAAEWKTRRSKKLLFCGAIHTDITAEIVSWEHSDDETCSRLICSSQQHTPLTLTKFFLYDMGDVSEQDGVKREFFDLLIEASAFSYQEFFDEQKRVLTDLWEKISIEIPDDKRTEQVLRLNMFQLYQSVGKDGKRSLSAKGITGGGYEGHYFWDTEIYGLPFFIYTQPEIARGLIAYRISIIPQARERAVQMSQKGILFPWRTINGYESSAYYPAGTAQYHINADIVYSLMTYLYITDDHSIMYAGGAELLFETARFWYDLGFFNDRKVGAFCIDEVTGPDEYSALVNNNFYTNVMARYNLQQAYAFYMRARKEYPDLIDQVTERIELKEDEPTCWNEAAQQMYIPFDHSLGVHPQDESFLDREKWDFASRPKENYPLLLHYHPLVIYRYQVLKQADVVLANFLRSSEFPWYERLRDFTYYEQLTTGDSSLSSCIQGIAAFDLGDLDRAVKHVHTTTFVDVDDVKGNAKDGLHTASMAGSWMSLVFGFAGMRRNGADISFAPVTHKTIHSYAFTVILHGCRLQIHVTEKQTYYLLLSGKSLKITHYGEQIELSYGEEFVIATRPPFKAVIFDLDGVITSTDSYHYQAWKQLSDERGWKFDKKLNQQLRGVSRRESLLIICRHNNAELSESEIKDAMTAKNTHYRDLLKQIDSNALLPGFLHLCDELKEHHILIGIASASRNASYIVERLQIERYIDFLVPAGQVVKGKPDPEVFVRCAESLGVPLASCAACEDAVVGIEAIKAARMKSVGVGSATAAERSDIHVDGLDELSYTQLAALWD